VPAGVTDYAILYSHEASVFIILDGDDIGRRITEAYITNNVEKLTSDAELVHRAVNAISEELRQRSFVVHFCAADGVVAETTSSVKPDVLFASIRATLPAGLNFSAGSGLTLQNAYLALLYAKSTGKNRHCAWSDLPDQNHE
jgi:hypothetical protein